MKFRNCAVSRDSIALSLFCGILRVRARFAYPKHSEPRQTNTGDTRGWRAMHYFIG